jgi:peptidoglycan hydrolase-like protein with peptidoglycan-binding domain
MIKLNKELFFMKKTIAIIILIALSIVSFAIVAASTDYQYAQVTTQKGPLNMRETASAKATKIDEIPNGTIISIVSRDDTWCMCIYHDQEGYVMTKFLSFVDISQFRTLSQNDSGQDILELKERLRELYFYDADAEINDNYDSDTETTVKSFQAAQGMEETGIASPELQAFLFWGPAKNNLPTKKLTVTISSKLTSNNHVGNSWSKYFSINGVKISSGDKLDIVLGESISVYSKITESDSSPDVGSVKEDIEITQDFFDNGFSITQKVTVTEKKGQYSGNKAYWIITYTFSP